MFSKPLFFESKAGVSNQPKTLYKLEPNTITLTPSIIMAGVLLVIVMLVICFGSITNYNYLLSGV